MRISDILSEINISLGNGDSDKAAKLTIENLPFLGSEPRTIYHVLDALYRGKHDLALGQLIEHVQENGLLKRESLILKMRMEFRAQQYEKALRTVHQLLQVAPAEIEGLRTGGRIGNSLQDQDMALGFWVQLAAAAPEDPEAPLQAARLKSRQGDFEEALHWSLRACQLQPHAEEPLALAVRAGLAVNWPEQCDTPLIQLFALNRDRGWEIVRRLQTTQAPETIARALAGLMKSYPAETDIISLADTLCSAWLSQGFDEELNCRDFDAAALYRAARLLQPQEQRAHDSIERLIQYCLGGMREAFLRDDIDAVSQNGDFITTLDPSRFDAWQMLGWCHLRIGSGSSAREAFQRCVELQPDDGHSWLDFGRALHRQGERAAAVDAVLKGQALIGQSDVQTSQEIAAAMAELYSNLLLDLREAQLAGNADGFWELYRAAARANPTGSEHEPLKRALLRDLRDQIQQMWKANSSDVAGPCRQFLLGSPDDVFVLTVLGRTQMRLRTYREALPVWERLARLNPQDAHFHLQIARCCRALKMRDRGHAAAETALRLDPQLHEAAEISEALKDEPVSA